MSVNIRVLHHLFKSLLVLFSAIFSLLDLDPNVSKQEKKPTASARDNNFTLEITTELFFFSHFKFDLFFTTHRYKKCEQKEAGNRLNFYAKSIFQDKKITKNINIFILIIHTINQFTS